MLEFPGETLPDTLRDTPLFMPLCLSTICPPSGPADAYLLAAVLESWPEMVDLLSKPVSIAILIAGMLGLIVGWMVRGREAAPAPEVLPATGLEELRWRHEKLVLTERQQVEKQKRLDEFANAADGHSVAATLTAALRLFVLAERVREARQKTGTDFSRMQAVRDRLGAVSVADGRELEAVKASARMAALRSATLEEAREALRGISDRVLQLESDASAGRLDFADAGDGLRRELREIKGAILSLPQGWATSGDETDRQIRELLAMVRAPEIGAVRDILLIDGAMTLSLSGAGGIDLLGAVGDLMVALENCKQQEPTAAPGDAVDLAETADTADGEGTADAVNGITALLKKPDAPGLTDIPFIGNPFLESAPEAPAPVLMQPDAGFRDPGDFAKMPVRIGKGFHDLTIPAPVTADEKAGPATEEAPAELPEENRSLVLFCSNDVELWGRDIYRGAHCRARAIKDFPAWAQWISIRRLDTRERVFAPVRTASLFNGQTSDPVGFNGTNELFYGARHLGIFSESCPNEVETRFTYGGWGFGHRANEITPEVEQLQAAGWEGREIPADTVFEIVIHEELPSLGALDRLLEPACGKVKR